MHRPETGPLNMGGIKDWAFRQQDTRASVGAGDGREIHQLCLRPKEKTNHSSVTLMALGSVEGARHANKKA